MEMEFRGERPRGGGLPAWGKSVGGPAVPRPPSRWKSRVLAPAVTLLAAAALLGYAARDALWPGVPVRVVPVVAKTISLADAGGSAARVGTAGAASKSQNSGGAGPAGAVVVQSPGWIEPAPYAVSASALTDGVVEDVLVLEGDPVKTGQVVARLVADDAKLALAKAEAELAVRRAALKAAKNTWDNPVERERAVQVAQAMLDEAKAELEKLPADLETETARLKGLEVEYQMNTAVPENAVSRLEVVQARHRAEAQAATVRSLSAKRPALEAKVRQYAAELTAAKESRRLRIEEARALAEAEAVVRLAETAVAEAKLRVERTEVKAPADGVVMQRLVEPGSKVVFGGDVAHSAHVVRLYDPGRLQVRVDVPLADAAKVGIGQAARITVDVLPDRTFAGVVTRAVHEADVQKNTQQFKVAITDPASQLKPEMLAKVKFLAGPTSRDDGAGGAAARRGELPADGGTVVFAPESLVRTNGEQSWVLALDPRERRAVRRAVVPGQARQDGWVAVLQGLSPGDRLIVSSGAVRDGQRVRITGEADAEHLREAAGDGRRADGRANGGRHGAD